MAWRWGDCSAGRVLEMKVWRRWWRTGCYWNPVDSAQEDDPDGNSRNQNRLRRSDYFIL